MQSPSMESTARLQEQQQSARSRCSARVLAHVDAQLRHAEHLLQKQATMENSHRLRSQGQAQMQSSRGEARQKQSEHARLRQEYAKHVQENLDQHRKTKEDSDMQRHRAKEQQLAANRQAEQARRAEIVRQKEVTIQQAQARAADDLARKRAAVAQSHEYREHRNQAVRAANEDLRQVSLATKSQQRLARQEWVATNQQRIREQQEAHGARIQIKLDRTAENLSMQQRLREEERAFKDAMDQKSAQLKELTDAFLTSGGDPRIRQQIAMLRQEMEMVVQGNVTAAFLLLGEGPGYDVAAEVSPRSPASTSAGGFSPPSRLSTPVNQRPSSGTTPPRAAKQLAGATQEPISPASTRAPSMSNSPLASTWGSVQFASEPRPSRHAIGR